MKILFILFMVAAFLLGWLSCETGLLSQGAVEWAFPWIVICAVFAILVWSRLDPITLSRWNNGEDK